MATDPEQRKTALSALFGRLAAATRTAATPAARLGVALGPLRRASSAGIAHSRMIRDATVGIRRVPSYIFEDAASSVLARSSDSHASPTSNSHSIRGVVRAWPWLVKRTGSPSGAARMRRPAGAVAQGPDAPVRGLAGPLARVYSRGASRRIFRTGQRVAQDRFTPGFRRLRRLLLSSRSLARALGSTRVARSLAKTLPRDTGPSESPAPSVQDGFRATLEPLARLFIAAHARLSASLRMATGKARIVALSVDGQESRFPRGTYSAARALAAASANIGSAPRVWLSEDRQPLASRVRRVRDLGGGSVRALARRGTAARFDSGRAIARRSSRFAPTLAASTESSGLSTPLLARLGHPAASPTILAAPPVSPSTINVAINVHGVTNGDQFVRRHAYEIAHVIDQVIERRARRSF